MGNEMNPTIFVENLDNYLSNLQSGTKISERWLFKLKAIHKNDKQFSFVNNMTGIEYSIVTSSDAAYISFHSKNLASIIHMTVKEYLTVNDTSSIIKESYFINVGRVRRIDDVKPIFKKYGMETDEVTKFENANPNWNQITNDLLNWTVLREQVKLEIMANTSNEVVSNSSPRYWTYAPGENARLWKDCLDNGVMLLGWDELGDLSQYQSKVDIQKKLQAIYKTDISKVNDTLANYEFVNKIQIGDIIIVKNGINKLLGYGAVTSDYSYDDKRQEYKSVRGVNWIKQGEWISPHSMAVKTLTDVTDYASSNPQFDYFYEELMAKMNETNITGLTVDNISHTKNIILYGPPGTGKTYSTKKKAVEIILSGKLENVDIDKKFNELKSDGRIEFVTFHQSYAYEQFVEGISVLTKDGNVVYEVKDGVFKRIGKFEILYQSLLYQLREVDDIGIDFNKSKYYIKANKEDNIKVLTTENKNDSQVVLTKEKLKQWYDGKYFDTNFKSYFDGVANYLSNHKDFIMKNMDRESRKEFFETQENFVLIIDEINRGNISKIFGELITLIEDDKRLGEENEIIVKLPYSGEDFGVPPNLYIIGTMNTADRSLVQLDTALRRRFDFEEMMPCYDENIWTKENKTGYDLRKFLEMLNGKISNQYDREHQIGHSYLMKVETITDLQRAWENRIMPLLQEYFYANYEDLAKVIGTTSEYLKHYDKEKESGKWEKENGKWKLNMKAGNFELQFKIVYDFVVPPNISPEKTEPSAEETNK